MKTIEYAQLSSKYTPYTYWGSIIIYLIFCPGILLFILTGEMTFSMQTILPILILLFLSWFVYYVFKNLSIGYIKNNEIYLKKMIGREEKYAYNEIEKVKAYDLGKDGYIVVTMKKGAVIKTYLLANAYMWYHGEDDIDAEYVLKEILAERNN